MTKWEKITFERKMLVINFLKANDLDAWELCKIAKELCCCGSCYYFVHHYAKSGEALDWGHCCKGNIQHSKKLSTACCGSWRLGDEEVHDEN